jgi:hypothetical protein
VTAATVGQPIGTGGWGRLAWPVWRQHRAGLIGFTVVSAMFAAAMLWAGLRGQAHYVALARYHCLGSRQLARCGPLLSSFPWLANSNYPIAVTWVARVLPVLAGVFLGAPALAREYERGTARFAWTQGTSRTRWVLASLALLAVPVVAVAAGLGALAEWSLQPFEALAEASRWEDLFETTPLTLAAWALFALLLGVTAGAVLRRVVPAMAVAGGAIATLVLVNAWKLHGLLLTTGAVVTRTRLLADQLYALPLINSEQFFFGGSLARAPAGSWVLDGWFAGRNGHRLTGAALNPLYLLKARQQQAWVGRHHVSVWISYQPGHHYWALQGLESSVLLILALTLAAATVVLIRRSST